MDAYLLGQIYMWGIVIGAVLGFSMGLHIIAAIINGLKQGFANFLNWITFFVSKFSFLVIMVILGIVIYSSM